MHPLFLLLKGALFNKTSEGLKGIDYIQLFDEAQKQTVATTVYSFLKSNSFLDNKQEGYWLKNLTPKVANTQKVFKLHADVGRLFNENNIPYCVLKGVAAAKYYPDPYARSMGDMDVLIKMQDVDKATKLLVNQGFIKGETDLKNGKHIVFKKNTKTVELHFKVPGLPKNDVRPLVEKMFEDIFEKSLNYETGYGLIKVPSDFHHGIILLLHSYQHLEGAGIGLRHLCDWAVFINKFDNSQFESIFKAPLINIGLWRFALVLNGAAEYIGADEKVKAESELSSFIINDITASGSFGKKDKDRMSNIQIASKVNDKKRSQLAQYIIYGVKRTYQLWPVFKKTKIFMPIGFLMYCVRMLFKMLNKKTRLYDLTESYQRNEQLKKLKCFKK